MNRPLLSICVITYNRVNFLSVSLPRILQEVRSNELVEVIVVDNASTDGTHHFLNSLLIENRFKSVIHNENLGPVRSIVDSGSKYASGEYVWILSDHNILTFNAVNILLSILQKNKHLDIFYANFRCAKYPEQWPGISSSGKSVEFEYLGNKDLLNREVAIWRDLVKSESALCTQLYAHIVKTEIWKSYWKNRPIPEPFKNGLGTYPHTYMIANTVFNKPSFYVGKPLITIFNGAQHWGDLESKLKVYLNGLPELIGIFKKKGLSDELVNRAYKSNRNELNSILLDYFTRKSPLNRNILLRGIFNNLFRPHIIFQIFDSFVNSRCCLFARILFDLNRLKNELVRYLFFNCRPARWFRSKVL